MADIVQQKNIGALIDVRQVMLAAYPWTAGGASDSVSFTSSSIDREGFATGSLPRSCDVSVFYSATLASGATISFYLDLQDSADNSTFADYATEAAAVVATGPSGGGAVNGVYRMTVQSTADNPSPGPGVNLGGARRYIRIAGNPKMSSPGDTAIIRDVVIVFGGFDQLAAPAT